MSRTWTVVEDEDYLSPDGRWWRVIVAHDGSQRSRGEIVTGKYDLTEAFLYVLEHIRGPRWSNEYADRVRKQLKG